MGESIKLITYNIQALCITISFVFSVKLCRGRNISGYMKGFFWYPTIAFLVLIPTFLSFNHFIDLRKIGNTMNNIAVLYHFAFLSFFIMKVMPEKGNKYFFYFLQGVIICGIILLLCLYPLGIQNKPAMAVANFGLMLFCMCYYYQLLNNIPTLNLRECASFWIITGIFGCMSVHIPIFASHEYFKIHNINMVMFTIINAWAFIIMHLFFIKGYFVFKKENSKTNEFCI